MFDHLKLCQFSLNLKRNALTNGLVRELQVTKLALNLVVNLGDLFNAMILAIQTSRMASLTYVFNPFLVIPTPISLMSDLCQLGKEKEKKKTQLSPFCLFVVGSSMAEDLLYFDVPLGIDLEIPTSQTKV